MEVITEKTIQLLLRSESILSAKEIASQINMSESSIKHNMKTLKQIVSKTGAKINSIPGKGVYLSATKKQRQELCELITTEKDKSSSFYYRRNYILDILFKKNSNYTIQIFADDLGVSRNVILSDLESIEKWLMFFNISLIRIRNLGLRCEGDEFNIREAIMDSNKQLMELLPKDLDRPDCFDLRISKTFYNYFSKFYNELNLEKIERVLLNCELKLHVHFEDTSFIQLVEYIALMCRRIKSGNIIILKNMLSKYQCTYSEYVAAKEVINELLDDTNLFLTMEIHCLAIQFSLYGCYDKAHHNLYEEEYYINASGILLKNVQDMANINIPLNNKIVADISQLFMKKRIHEGYQPLPNKYLINDIKDNSSNLYGVVLANMKIIEESFSFKFRDSDIAYVTMLIDNAKIKKDERVKTLLVTSFDHNIATYLKNKIEKRVNNIFIVSIINVNEYQNSMNKNFELVLTTVLMDESFPLKISRRVDSHDIQNIQESVNSRIKERSGISFKQNDLIQSDLIITNFKARKKEDVLEKGCEILQRSGYTEDGFFNILIEKENVVSTAIGNGVAMPHGFRTHIKKSGIAIIQLKNAIDWTESEKVKVAFIFAINSENRKEVMGIFANFYEIVSTESIINQIKDSKNSEELYSYVRNLGKKNSS